MVAMKAYEITWASGKVETFEASSVRGGETAPGRGRGGQGHIQFFQDLVLVLSAREADVISVRLIVK